ncbi:MAG: MTAP family purine nucleoside phosphorylase [Halobacteriota archaeon]
MTIRIGVIGGTGLYELCGIHRSMTVETLFGNVAVGTGDIEGKEVVFLPRHGQSHDIPPHAINYEANMTALKQLGVHAVIGVNAVGALNPALRMGDYVIPDQFIDFTKSRHTVFTSGVRHVDMRQPYCEGLRTFLHEALQGTRCHGRGTYVSVEGPRFETEAELRMFTMLGGDVIGMTGVPEATISRELAMCYATLSLVTNEVSRTGTSHDEIVRFFASKALEVERITHDVIKRIPLNFMCGCQKD